MITRQTYVCTGRRLAFAALGVFLFHQQGAAISIIVPSSPITFTGGQVSASAGFGSQTQQNSASGLPSTAMATASDSNAISTTNGSFASTGFSFTFTQSFADPDGTSGSGYADFTVNSATSYTITDPAASTTDTDFDTVAYTATLTDLTSNTTVYTTADGSATGNLIVGNSYQFKADASMQTIADPTLSYTPSIAFGSPLTSSAPEDPAPMIPILLGGLALLRNSLRRFVS